MPKDLVNVVTENSSSTSKTKQTRRQSCTVRAIILAVFTLVGIGFWFFNYKGSAKTQQTVELARQTGLDHFICRAALTGDANSQCRVGDCFTDPSNRYHDDLVALSWHKKSAGQGLARALYHLGLAYATEKGVERDDNMASEMFQLAAAKGDLLAANKLGECYQSGTGLERDEVLASKWYKVASDGGCPEGMVNLSRCFLAGTCGMLKDRVAAEFLLRKAASLGNKTAEELLNALAVKPEAP